MSAPFATFPPSSDLPGHAQYTASHAKPYSARLSCLTPSDAAEGRHERATSLSTPLKNFTADVLVKLITLLSNFHVEELAGTFILSFFLLVSSGTTFFLYYLLS